MTDQNATVYLDDCNSPWCRFEADLAHNTLMDQNRDGLILIRLEELSFDSLETVAPQLHFLLKTRIYLDWIECTEDDEEMFWKKLRRALGFTTYGPYGTVKQYYHHYWLSKICPSSRTAPARRAITDCEPGPLHTTNASEKDVSKDSKGCSIQDVGR